MCIRDSSSSTTGAYEEDLTPDDWLYRMEGFMYAETRETAKTMPINGDQVTITSVSATQYLAADGLDVFNVGDLILADNFTNVGNNGLKRATAVAAGTVTAAGLVAEASPPSDAKLTQVGFQFTTADATITTPAGALPQLNATTKDLTDLNLTVGSWVVVGGDLSANQFDTDGANFIGRVYSISADAIVFDKSNKTIAADAGTGKTIRIFIADMLKNEADPDLIESSAYQFERTGGEDADGVVSQYFISMQPTTCTINLPVSAFVAATYNYQGEGSEGRDGSEGLKAGTRPNVTSERPFTTTSSMIVSAIQPYSAADAFPSPYFTYVQDAAVTIDNSVGEVFAHTSLAAIENPEGSFVVNGTLTTMLRTDNRYLDAIREGTDATYHAIWASVDNLGLVMDLPLVTLSGGEAEVADSDVVKISTTFNASASRHDGNDSYTIAFNYFNYIPDALVDTD